MDKLIAAMVAASVLLFGAVGIQAQQTDPAGGSGTTQTADQKQTPKKHHHKAKHHKKAKQTQETPAESTTK